MPRKTRFIASVIAAAAAPQPALPWTRGTARAAMIEARKTPPKAKTQRSA